MAQIGYYGSFVSCGEFEGTKYITTIKINDIPKISEWDFGVVNKLKDPNHCTYMTKDYEILSIETLDGIQIDHTKRIPFLNRCIETGQNCGSASFVFSKKQVIDNFISEIVYYHAYGNSKDSELIRNYSGPVTEYSATGAISSECVLENGIAQNQIIYYHNNGNIRYIIPVDENGKAHGDDTQYTEEGKIKQIQRYCNGKKDGEEIYHSFLTGYVGFKSKDNGKLGIQTIEVYDGGDKIEPYMIGKVLSSEKYRIRSMEEIDNCGNSKILDLREIYQEPYKIRRDYTGFVLSREQVFDLV